MSIITEHINKQSLLLFEIPEKLNIISFFAKLLSTWYIKKLDVLRVEILGIVSMIKNNEIEVDSKSHFIFQKLFAMVYRFNKLLESDQNPSLYNLKLAVNKLYDSLKELLILHEQALLSDQSLPIYIAEDPYLD